jgi:hypothetical protein
MRLIEIEKNRKKLAWGARVRKFKSSHPDLRRLDHFS